MSLYKEHWVVPFAPIVFFLPCFYTYGVTITESDVTFGYGLLGPWCDVTAKKVPLTDIDFVYTGSWDWRENLRNLGGWGIRYGHIAPLPASTDAKDETEKNQLVPKKKGWAYNASNGDFVVIRLKNQGCYQFVSKDANSVKRIIESRLVTN